MINNPMSPKKFTRNMNMKIVVVMSTIEPRNDMQKNGVRAQRGRESVREVFKKQVTRMLFAAS